MCYSHGSGDWAFEIRVSAWLSKDPLPGCRLLIFLTWQKVLGSSVRLFHKGTNPIDDGEALMT